MKKSSKYFPFFLLISVFCFISCSNSSTNTEIFSLSAGRGSVYNGIYYFFSKDSIYYIDCESNTEPLPLCSDTLCSHSTDSCPAYFPDIGKRLLLVDKWASDKNSKYPIIYISCDYGNDNKIIRFDVKTNKKETMLSNIPNNIQSFSLYNDLLYYTTFEGESQLNIIALNVQNRATYKLNNDENLRFYIGGIDHQHIYFTDYDGNIYRAPHDLSSKEFIGSSVTCGKVYISDNKIFFLSNIHVKTVINEIKFLTCDLLSIDKNNLTSDPTLVLKDISYIDVPVIFKYDNTFFYCLCDDITAQKTIDKFNSMDNTTTAIQLFDDGTSSIYMYDIIANKSSRIIENSDYNIGMFFSADNQFFAYGGFPYNLDDISEHGIKTKTIIIDYKNNKHYIY